MGIGASVTNSVPVENADNYKPVEYNLKRLPEAIEEAFYVHEKFPLIIDPTEQASRFLKYQTGSFLSYDDPVQSSKSAMNRALVGALQHGRSLTIKFQTLEGLNESVFEPGVFPIEVLSRSEFFKDEVWHSVIKTDLGDPNPSEVSISSEFLFIICTTSEVIPPQLYDVMHVFKIVDHAKNGESVETQTGDATIDQIASMFGAQEIIRYVPDLC